MLINLLQRHHLWVFILLSGLSGLALGHLGATGISILATPASVPALSKQATPEKKQSRTPLKSYQAILNRDIFNSAGGAQSLGKIIPLPSAQQKPNKATSKWKLIGTISGGKVPLATLFSVGKTTAYRLNETLPDGMTLSSIERNRVVLKHPDGRTVVVEILMEGTHHSAKSKPVPSAATGSRTPGFQVEDLGKNRWHIPAEVAEDARANIGNLLTQAQAVPFLVNGKTTGFQIRMIQAGSLIAQLGLKKGDILREVNGVSLNSPEKALQIFGQLRQAKQISIGLERRGKAMTFAYEIR